jgi:hypothetical protein
MSKIADSNDRLDLDTFLKMHRTSPEAADQWAEEAAQRLYEQGEVNFRFGYRMVPDEPGMMQAIFTFPSLVETDEMPPDLTGPAAVEHMCRWSMMIQQMLQMWMQAWGEREEGKVSDQDPS